MEFTAYAIPTPNPKLYVKIRGQSQTTRSPVHFIAVLDTSGSMDAEGRLTNCKDSLRFLTHFLTATDRLSIITFSSHASAVMKAVPMDRTGATQLESILSAVVADGGTNMSSAINCIQECIAGAPALKTDILFLTDGHANEGIISKEALHAMLNTKLRDYPTVGVSSVGYGVDHNVDLLRGIAEGHDGSYNVVCNRENVASVFGLLLGGLMSCVGSNVEITAPAGTICLPANLRMVGDGQGRVKVHVGDVYADTETQILLSLPSAFSSAYTTTLPISAYDVAVSEDVLVLTAVQPADETIQQEVQMFELRQDVSALLRRCSAGAESTATLLADVVAMKARITGTDPVSAMLLRSLTEAEEVLRTNNLNNQTRVLFAQNSAYTQMGRGLRATVSAAHAYSGATTVAEDPDDSPFASPLQRQYRQISQALSVAAVSSSPEERTLVRGLASAVPSNPTTPHHTIQRQVARHLTDEEIASLEQLSGELAPPRAPTGAAHHLTASPLLANPPQIQYATNLFSAAAPLPLTPPFGPLTRQIAAPSRQTSNASNEPPQRLGFISPDMSPIFNPSAAPRDIPVFSLGGQPRPA